MPLNPDNTTTHGDEISWDRRKEVKMRTSKEAACIKFPSFTSTSTLIPFNVFIVVVPPFIPPLHDNWRLLLLYYYY